VRDRAAVSHREQILGADRRCKELRRLASIAMITSIISIEVATMIREAPAMTVRQNLGELLNEVQYRHGKVLITKAGKPVAALVDIAMFTRLRKLDEEFDRMRAELAQAFAGMTETAVDALVDEAVKDVRARRRKK
jgi:prevent-host-death family protein